MRKMELHLYAGVQCNSWEFYDVPDYIDQKDLNEYAWQAAIDFAGRYGYYPIEWLYEIPEDEYPEDDSHYVSHISGTWCEYDPVKHDGKRINSKIYWNQY